MSVATAKATGRDDWVLMVLATLGAIGALYYLWLSNPLNDLVGASAIGELETAGTIQRRRAGLLFWEKLRGESSLFLKDTLVSPSDTSATISLNNGTVIEMETQLDASAQGSTETPF